MLFSKKKIELLLVLTAISTVMYGSYKVFGILDVEFLIISICSINACWHRYFDDEVINECG